MRPVDKPGSCRLAYQRYNAGTHRKGKHKSVDEKLREQRAGLNFNVCNIKLHGFGKKAEGAKAV